jgi:hypothetical protein
MTDLVVVAAVVLVQLKVHYNPSYLLSGDTSCVHPIVLEHVGRIVLMDAAEKLGMLMIMLKMMLAWDDDDGGDCGGSHHSTHS